MDEVVFDRWVQLLSEKLHRRRVGIFAVGAGILAAQPADVAVDGADNIYVADRGNNRVQEFGPANGA